METEFVFRNGLLHVENVPVRQIYAEREDMEPMFIFSKNKIILNVQQYRNELEKQSFASTINYSMKANANPAILKILKENGCSLTLVSGLELKLALELDFPKYQLVLNGNGKQKWEIELAIENGVLLNIDSVFDLEQITSECRRLNKPVRVLLRINPNIEVDVHQHNCTGKAGSKFGLDEMEFGHVVSALRDNGFIQLVGLHCHLGSTIDDVNAIAESTAKLVKIFKDLKRNFESLKYINIGGGLGIPYRKLENETLAWKSLSEVSKQNLDNLFHELTVCKTSKAIVERFKSDKISAKQFLDTIKANCTESNSEVVRKLLNFFESKNVMPTPADLIQKIKPFIDDDIHLILEPGRSLIGNAAVLLCSVIGCKKSSDKNFLVVNAAMTEVIRPSMYGAYHHIDLAEPSSNEKNVYNVVGPVCESGDFLGKNRLLPTPHVGCLLAIFDVGAYCGSMSMTYNMRRRPAEFLVDGDSVMMIRRADTYADLLEPYRVV